MPSKIVKLPSGGFGVSTVTNDIGELLQATLTIPSKEMVSLVRNYIIGRSPLAANELGLFTIKGGITTDKYAIAMLNRAKHLWSSRKDGCQFSPKGRINCVYSSCIPKNSHFCDGRTTHKNFVPFRHYFCI